MREHTVTCALLAVMVAKHRWGTPIQKEALLAVSAIESHEYQRARAAFERLRSETYIESHGNRGIELDSSQFGELADVLYHECRWEPFHIKSRLKHYEGWDKHDWG